jgi:sterol 24-C-methyltransferase
MTSVVQGAWNSLVRAQTGKTSQDADALRHEAVASAVDEYAAMFDEKEDEKGQSAAKIAERKGKYTTMINHYYDLVTDFYEYGWGQSFHFAPRHPGESFAASVARHEFFLAQACNLREGMKALDVGCGVGGPMRAIAKFTGAKIVGINNNDYQLKRLKILNEREGVAHLCSGVKGNFMAMPFEPNSFDAVYAIEATCHAPDKVACYKECFKALKEGGYFCGYDWVMTDKYDPKNAEHNHIKHVIERGDSLPDLPHYSEVITALEKAGFEILEHHDCAVKSIEWGNTVTWYSTLQGSLLSPSQFKHSKVGRFCTQKMVDVLEFLHIAPKGTSKTHFLLSTAADALARGGETGIFTPMYYFRARKPIKGEKKPAAAAKN